jgi:hypothetical protein
LIAEGFIRRLLVRLENISLSPRFHERYVYLELALLLFANILNLPKNLLNVLIQLHQWLREFRVHDVLPFERLIQVDGLLYHLLQPFEFAEDALERLQKNGLHQIALNFECFHITYKLFDLAD